MLIEVAVNAKLTINRLTIRGGRTEFGGGISSSGTLIVNSSVIENNSARRSGGGISNSGTLTVNGGVIENNSADSMDFGGCGINNTGTLELIDSIVTGNHGGDRGGILNAGTAVIVRSSITHNSSAGFQGEEC